MRHYMYTYQTNVSFSVPIERHEFRLHCQPYSNCNQKIEKEFFLISPECWTLNSKDCFGNRTIVGGNLNFHKSFGYITSGIISIGCEDLPCVENSYLYTVPTELTTPTNDLMDLFIPEGSCFSKAEFICHYVHNLLGYESGVTHSSTSVENVLSIKKGVCQDFSHVMISICRIHNIPARYVCGLMLGEGETHAWVEVCDGTCWRGFDPTNDCAVNYGYIKIAQGRDAFDCSVCNGVFVGNASQNTHVMVSVFEV